MLPTKLNGKYRALTRGENTYDAGRVKKYKSMQYKDLIYNTSTLSASTATKIKGDIHV